MDSTSVPTAESRARDEALLEAIAAEQADAPDRRPSVAPRRSARRTGLARLLELFDAWRSAPSETTHAPAAPVESNAPQTQVLQTQAE